MRSWFAILPLATFITLSAFGFSGPKPMADFALPNANGASFSTRDYPQAKGFIVIFTCNHCPFAKLYSKRMNALNSEFSKLQVPLIAVNSMDTLVYEDESFGLMQEKARQDSFNFPYLQDATQRIGKEFGAEHTPMAFVIWKEKAGFNIRYKGAIDDNGENPELATPFVANAVKELLQNKKVTQTETPSLGCRIFYRKKQTP